jgi:prolipoprotein diacylglyceryltransferase
MFVFVFTVFGFIYSIIKKDQKLFSLSFATVAGWAVWRVIGGAILWYGIGLIMRTILVLSMFIQDLISNKKQDKDETHNLLVALTLGIL